MIDAIKSLFDILQVPLALESFNNVLHPVFCKGEATFSHLSGEGILGRFFQLGHLDLLHTALLDSNTYLYMVETVKRQKQ